MSRFRIIFSRRFLAALLALAMVIGVIPFTVFAKSEGDSGDDYTIVVRDSAGHAVPEAEITYQIYVDDVAGAKKTAAKTGEDGTAAIDLSAYAGQFVDGKYDGKPELVCHDLLETVTMILEKENL